MSYVLCPLFLDRSKVMTPTNDSLWAARRARARRWLQAGQELRGYPALHAE
jgi:hypothetical protein